MATQYTVNVKSCEREKFCGLMKTIKYLYEIPCVEHVASNTKVFMYYAVLSDHVTTKLSPLKLFMYSIW